MGTLNGGGKSRGLSSNSSVERGFRSEAQVDAEDGQSSVNNKKTVDALWRNVLAIFRLNARQTAKITIFLLVSPVLDFFVLASFIPLLDIFVFSDRNCDLLSGNYEMLCASLVNATLGIETNVIIAAYVGLILFATVLRVVSYWVTELYSGRIVTEILSSELSWEMSHLSSSSTQSAYGDALTKHTANTNQLMSFIRSALSIIPSVAFITLTTIGVFAIIGGVSAILTTLFALSYLAILISFRSLVSGMSSRLKQRLEKLVTFISEALSDLRSNVVFGKQKRTVKQYARLDDMIRKDLALTNSLSIAPRYVLEGLLVVFGVLFVVLSSSDLVVGTKSPSGGYGSAATLLLFSLRLIPTAQQLYGALINIQITADIVSCYAPLKFARMQPSDLAESVGVKAVHQVPLRSLHCNAVRVWSPHGIDDRRVSFCAARGELVLIKGESGIGKSSLLDQIMGFKPYKAGDISFLLENGSRIAPSEVIYHQRVALVTQNPFISSEDSENRFFVPTDRTTVSSDTKWIRRLGLDDLVRFSERDGFELLRSSGLSGGEKQRLALLRALIARREVTILDEPIAALDRGLSKEVVHAINEMLATSLVIAVMHGDELDYLANHVVRLTYESSSVEVSR